MGNFHLGGYIIGYTIRNYVLRLRLRVAVKLNFRPYIRRYTSPNEDFEYSYPLILFMLNMCICLLFFLSKLTFSHISFRKTIRMSDCLDPDVTDVLFVVPTVCKDHQQTIQSRCMHSHLDKWQKHVHVVSL